MFLLALLCLRPASSHSRRRKTKRAPAPRARWLRGLIAAGGARRGKLSGRALARGRRMRNGLCFGGGKLAGWAVSADAGGKAEPALLAEPGERRVYSAPWGMPGLFLGASREVPPSLGYWVPPGQGGGDGGAPVPARLGVGRGGIAHPATQPGGFAGEKRLFRRCYYQLHWVSSSKNRKQNSPS